MNTNIQYWINIDEEFLKNIDNNIIDKFRDLFDNHAYK